MCFHKAHESQWQSIRAAEEAAAEEAAGCIVTP